MKRKVIGGICLAIAMLFGVTGCQSEEKAKKNEKTTNETQTESLIPKGEESEKL